MRKGMLVTVFCGFLADGLVAQVAPLIREAESVMVKEVCLDLVVEVIRFPTHGLVGDARIPFCYERPELRHDCVARQFSPGRFTTNCTLYRIDASQAYYRFKSQHYEFSARMTPHPHNVGYSYRGRHGGFFTMGHSNGMPWGESSFMVSAPWDYHISRLLSAFSSDLPVQFASIILPSLDSRQHSLIGTNFSRDPGATPRDSTKIELNNFLYGIEAIGYDHAGQEYGINITTEFDHFVFQHP